MKLHSYIFKLTDQITQVVSRLLLERAVQSSNLSHVISDTLLLLKVWVLAQAAMMGSVHS